MYRINWLLLLLPLLVNSSNQYNSNAPLQVRSADMSALAIEDCDMTCNKFKSSSTSTPQDALVILAEAGFNTVRLRVWVNPTADHNEGNLSYVVSLAKRAHAAGLSVWVDFHLSDWWADPGKQNKPSAWSTFDFNTLSLAVANHVTSALRAIDAVCNVSIVQVGNEITSGTLWPETGQECSDSGAVYVDHCSSNWNALGILISSGIKAARLTIPTALIAVHTDLGNRGVNAARDSIDWYTTFISALPPTIDFDIIALSYYMMWNASGPTGEENLATSLRTQFPNKQVLMAETSYPWNIQGNNPPPGEYAATPEGQCQFWKDTVSKAANSKWLGVSWWGSEYAGQYGMVNSLFDENYVALPALTNGWKSIT